MKKMAFLFLSAAVAVLMSCGGNSAGKPKLFPKPGAMMAQDSMPVTEDPLNHFTFSVKVIADSSVAQGIYDVDADFGPNFAGGQFTLPKGCEDAKPVIRKGTDPYTYIIGFKIAGDTTFYDYFQVTSSRNNTKMQYIKAYTF